MDKTTAYIRNLKAILHHNTTKFSHDVFEKRAKLETKSVDVFITKIKTLVKACSYTKESERIWDKIVSGVNNTTIHERLLAEGDQLMLEITITIQQTYEMTKAQLKILEEKKEIEQEIDSVARNRKYFLFDVLKIQWSTKVSKNFPFIMSEIFASYF